MKNLTWQNPEQLFVAQELINKVKSKCCGIKVKEKNTGGRMMNDVKIGDVIAITDGVDIVATAKVISSPSYLSNYSLSLPPQILNFFDYNGNANDTVAVKVNLVRTNIKIPYRQGAFCEILDSTLQSQLP